MGQGTLIGGSVIVRLIVISCVARSTVIVTRHYKGDIYHERQDSTGNITISSVARSTVIVTRHYNGDIYHERQDSTGNVHISFVD